MQTASKKTATEPSNVQWINLYGCEHSIEFRNCGFAVVIFLALLLTPSAYGTSLLQDLLVDYHKYGLPLPSANAKLVYVTSSGKTNLAFIQKGTNDSIFLSGTFYRKFAEPATIKDIDQADVKLEDTDFRAVVTVGNQGLCFAIQCESIGLHSLATLVLDRALSSRFDYTFLGNMLEPGGLKPVLDEGLSPKERLWCSAWHFWLHELGKPESDRAAILGRMQSMLQSERGITSGEAATLVDCLRKTLLPNNAQPGTIDDFINQLTEVTFLGESESVESGSEFRYHPMVLRIVEMGFDAVPSLIEHLDDDRLTRELGPKACGGWCPPFIYPIGFCMEWILRDLAGKTR